MLEFDIVIVGAGMVGAALACALGDTTLRIAVIDSTPAAALDDPRLIALNYNSICLFKNIGIWPHLMSHATAIKEVHVSHRGHFGVTRIQASELHLNELGFLVPAKYINAALSQQLTELNSISVLRPATLTHLEQSDDSATIQVTTPSGNQAIKAQMVIAADGTHSTVRQLLGIETDTTDYQQKAIVSIVELKRSHDNVAYERFLNSGAVAMLPLTDNRVAMIWTDHEKNIDRLMTYDDERFLTDLQSHFGYRLGRLCRINQRFVFPLKLIQAKEQIKQRTLLIGNAAHTIHPIAAQGLNLALFEVAELAEHLTTSPTEKLSLPHLRQSTQQQKATIQLSHRLTWLFSMESFLFSQTRQLALVGLDACLPIKQRFAKKAMAMATPLPRLLRTQL